MGIWEWIALILGKLFFYGGCLALAYFCGGIWALSSLCLISFGKTLLSTIPPALPEIPIRSIDEIESEE
jgi:hypothetical protein